MYLRPVGNDPDVPEVGPPHRRGRPPDTVRNLRGCHIVGLLPLIVFVLGFLVTAVAPLFLP